MIIWLASYPRSGNHWLRILIHQLYGLPTYTIYAGERTDIKAASLMGYPGGTAPVEQFRHDNAWRFIKTHENPSDNEQAVYILRDGRDTLVSHARYAIAYGVARDKDGKPTNDFEAVLEGMILRGAWTEHVRAWTQRPQTVIVRFKDLIRTPVHTTMWIMQEIGYDGKRHNNRLPNFEELQRDEGTLFRRGKIGSYKDEMSPRLQALFYEHCGELV